MVIRIIKKKIIFLPFCLKISLLLKVTVIFSIQNAIHIPRIETYWYHLIVLCKKLKLSNLLIATLENHNVVKITFLHS